MNIIYGIQNIEFSVEYKKRKTFKISIEPPDRVHVVAPLGSSQDMVMSIASRKAKWITQKLEILREVGYEQYKRAYVNGESFSYLGESYILQIVIDEGLKKASARLAAGELIVDSPDRETDKLRLAIENFYRAQTLEKVKERIEHYCIGLKVAPKRILVKQQKKRWGSCSSKGNLNFNWRCSMAPLHVLDYIIVHELCHLVHLNHSPDFWNTVEQVLPDYRQRRAWLKKYGVSMDL